jgi:xanthine/uracil permease
MINNGDGTTSRDPCPDAYGTLLGLSFLLSSQAIYVQRITGTTMVCSFFEVGLSFAPAETLKRIFSPIVTGTVILMISASLIGGSGVADWGGGSNDDKNRPIAPYGNRPLY